MRRKASDDISKPLRNSFIHTGHYGDATGNNWGFHDKIDKVYLNNPMEPPDLLRGPNSRIIEPGPPILPNRKNTSPKKYVDLIEKNVRSKAEKSKNTVLTSILPCNKQFNYSKLTDGKRSLRPAPGRPPGPFPQIPNGEQVLVDLDGCTPPPINHNNSLSMNSNLSILDQPIDVAESRCFFKDINFSITNNCLIITTYNLTCI